MPALLINCPAGQVAVLSSLKMKSEGRNRLTSFSCPVAFFSDSGSGLDIIKHTEIKRREDWLAAITAAKLRLEQRQQEADTARGRSENDQRKPRGKDGKPKGGRYTRDFGVPKDNTQESFTDTDSRIMKRAGGGYDYSYNAHTAVDEAAQIVVAAELTNNAADSDRLPVLLAAVKANLGTDADQVLADAGFRSEAVFEQLKDSPSELIVALGREGKQAVAIDAEQYPHTAAMDAKLKRALDSA